MPLTQEIIDLIRDEVGNEAVGDMDFVDNISDYDSADDLGSLEQIYIDTDRGNFSILGTALIVWRRRLNNHRLRAFDVSKEGNWYARSQMTRFLKERVKEYEALTGSSKKSQNMTVLSEAESQGLTNE